VNSLVTWFMDPANTEIIENILVLGLLAVASFAALFACGVLSGIIKILLNLDARVRRLEEK